MSKLLYLLIAIAFLFPPPAQETVRQDLARHQMQTGLTLASFYRELETVDFANRSTETKKIHIGKGIPQQGAVSRDGEYIAFEMSVDHPYRTYLGIAHSDGSGLREYPEIGEPGYLCWSYNKSKMALNTAVRRQLHGELVIVDLESKATQELEAGAYVTSQCWSPDDKQVVYGAGSHIQIYDLAEKKSHELVRGEDPAWSPDGTWIAFRDHDSYYVIRPSGADRKLLFMVREARGGIWWSPDATVVAYHCRDGSHSDHTGFATRQLRIRRLSDDSDDWITEDADVEYLPSYQWVTPAQAATH